MVGSPGEGGVPDGELPPHRGQADHQGPGDTRAGRGVSVLGEKREEGHQGHTKQNHKQQGIEKLQIGSLDKGFLALAVAFS